MTQCHEPNKPKQNKTRFLHDKEMMTRIKENTIQKPEENITHLTKCMGHVNYLDYTRS